MPSAFHHHFRRHDPVLHGVIRQVGPFRLQPSRDRFGMLARSIISQQISVGAARSIRQRLEDLLGSAGISAAAIAALPPDRLRGVGLSRQKTAYLLDLAGQVVAGTVRLDKIGRLNDEQVIEQLTQVKGIGRWTAQMFLIFSLGRPDVFPADDLGVRMAIGKLYGFAELPGRKECLAIGEKWSPHASVGSWYCWRYLDLLKQRKAEGKEYPV
ncbi:MAG: DNA-3-methyladenine glycosylase 2 family protein [Pirellulaceae bacterium]|nr:DNA-3-methyladenine glycosylase 2 family protein [Pirellulaceae bacterium]